MEGTLKNLFEESVTREISHLLQAYNFEALRTVHLYIVPKMLCDILIKSVLE